MNAHQPKIRAATTEQNAPNLQPEGNDFIPYAAQVDTAMRLEACGGDYALFLRKECERLDVIFEPLKGALR